MNQNNDENIAEACDAGDSVIEYLIDEGLIERKLLYNLDTEGNIITEGEHEDPSGFTGQGRDLFEFVYNLVRND